MRVIDLREQFVVYVIYSGEGKWYVSDKEIWFLDYKKRVEVFRKAGYEPKEAAEKLIRRVEQREGGTV